MRCIAAWNKWHATSAPSHSADGNPRSTWDDENWHCFTLYRYDRETGKWTMEEGAGLPHHRLTTEAPR